MGNSANVSLRIDNAIPVSSPILSDIAPRKRCTETNLPMNEYTGLLSITLDYQRTRKRSESAVICRRPDAHSS
jgi:hypothetical protein